MNPIDRMEAQDKDMQKISKMDWDMWEVEKTIRKLPEQELVQITEIAYDILLNKYGHRLFL
jgi:hypothetical protein